MISINVLCIFAAVGFVAAMPPKTTDDCDKICPAIWAPICATDGEELRTFPNPCQLTVFNCVLKTDFQLLKAGLCDKDVREEAVQGEDDAEHRPQELDGELKVRRCFGCPRIYLPVCGADGKEVRMFPNECEMEAFNCEESRNFSMMKEGDDC